MLPEIKKVRDEALKCHNSNGCLTLQNVSNIFQMYSSIDEVEYIGYDVPVTNPIWGRFSKWKMLGAYTSEKTYCKVQYASHLSEEWRAFVVCKELCHSLHTNDGSHSVSNSAVVNLVNSLALASASMTVQPSNPFMAERLAEFGALEILIPVSIRQSMIASGEHTKMTSIELAKKLNCPLYYISYIFSQPVIDFSLKNL
jgi:hypothetical protein